MQPGLERSRLSRGLVLVAAVALLAACSAAAVTAPPATPTATTSPTATATSRPTASPSPSPSPTPTPTLVPAPLTGRLVSPAVAARHAIAVMVDDHRNARPQSGFRDASIVWHAPAEGGIPRYMLVFGEGSAPEIGPVRSARDYFILWAAEWNALFAHSGGSPRALRTLRESGDGQLVWDADEFRFGRSFWRSNRRYPPHNLYTSSDELRALAAERGAEDGLLEPAWKFGSELPKAGRPDGGSIETAFGANRIRYDYDRSTNTYPRSVSGGTRHVDAATDERVAPTNVVVMLMRFGALDDGTNKGRLEADVVGSGTAWLASNGTTVKGTWRKSAPDAPTLFFDARGRPFTFAPGQTFIQVMPTGTKVSVTSGD